MLKMHCYAYSKVIKKDNIYHFILNNKNTNIFQYIGKNNYLDIFQTFHNSTEYKKIKKILSKSHYSQTFSHVTSGK